MGVGIYYKMIFLEVTRESCECCGDVYNIASVSVLATILLSISTILTYVTLLDSWQTSVVALVCSFQITLVIGICITVEACIIQWKSLSVC